MDLLTDISIIIGIIVGSSAIIGGILSMWLKSKLQDLITSVEVLNSTVNHFVKVQDDISERINKVSEHVDKNTERIITNRTKINSAHDRLDRMDGRSQIN